MEARKLNHGLMRREELEEELALRNLRALIDQILPHLTLNLPNLKPKRPRLVIKKPRVGERRHRFHKQQEMSVWTKRFMTMIRECLACQRWDEAAKVVHALTYEIDRTPEIIWMAGFLIFCNHPNSQPEHLRQFSIAIRKLDKVFHPAILLKTMLIYLAKGDFSAAKDILGYCESAMGQEDKWTEKQKQIGLLLRGYKAMFLYIDWLTFTAETASVEEIDEEIMRNQINDKERLANEAIQQFEQIFATPGFWDIFIEKYITLMEFCKKQEMAIEMLKTYVHKNPFHANGYIFFYDLVKKYYPNSSKLPTILMALSVIKPCDKRILDLPKLAQKKDDGFVLETLFNFVDYPEWKCNVTAWRSLAKFLLKMREEPEERLFLKLAVLWAKRISWWPKFHFRKRDVVIKCRSDASLFTQKAIVCCALQSTDNKYFKVVEEKLLKMAFTKHLEKLKKIDEYFEEWDNSSDDDAIKYKTRLEERKKKQISSASKKEKSSEKKKKIAKKKKTRQSVNEHEEKSINPTSENEEETMNFANEFEEETTDSANEYEEETTDTANEYEEETMDSADESEEKSTKLAHEFKEKAAKSAYEIERTSAESVNEREKVMESVNEQVEEIIISSDTQSIQQTPSNGKKKRIVLQNRRLENTFKKLIVNGISLDEGDIVLRRNNVWDTNRDMDENENNEANLRTETSLESVISLTSDDENSQNFCKIVNNSLEVLGSPAMSNRRNEISESIGRERNRKKHQKMMMKYQESRTEEKNRTRDVFNSVGNGNTSQSERRDENQKNNRKRRLSCTSPRENDKRQEKKRRFEQQENHLESRHSKPKSVTNHPLRYL